MMWRRAAWSGGAIVLAIAVWVMASGPLELVGLGDFDPLARICVVLAVLSIAEAVLARALRH